MKPNQLIAVALFFATTQICISQNTYWTQQYGSRSSLMGGAVVGGVQDNSALYYNPAGIAYIDSAYLNVSANAYGIDYIQLKNGAGTGLDLTSLKTLIYPQFISGLIKFKLMPKFKIAYGLLTRFRSEVKMNAENDGMYKILLNSPDSQYYYGTFDYELSSISQWGGISLAYKFNPKFSMGLTTFFTYTHFEDRRNTFCTADVSMPNPDSSYTAKFQNSQFNQIDHFGLLFKLGFQFNWERFKLGWAITTPSVSLFGFGRIGRTIEYQNQNRFLTDTNALARHSNWLVSDDHKGLRTDMRMPLSLSVGFEYLFKKTNTKFTMTAEAFYTIPKYVVAHSDDPVYVRPTDTYNGKTFDSLMYINVENTAFANVAIGIDQKVGKRTQMYLGIRTDLNNAVDYNGQRTITTNTLNPTYNHYVHFSGGFTIRKGHSDITFGLNYGLGFTKLDKQVVNLSSPGVNANLDNQNLYFLLQGPKQNLTATNVHSISLIIGYTYYSKR